MEPCFIVGMPRAASTWLMRSLNTHPQVVAFGETMFWGRAFVKPDGTGKYRKKHLELVSKILKDNSMETVVANIDGNIEPGFLRNIRFGDIPSLVDSTVKNLVPPVSPGDVFLGFAGEIAKAEGKSRWVEKTPHHINWTDRIVDNLGESRFVILVREPYSFMLSYKNQRGWKGQSVELFSKLYHPIGCSVIYRTYARQANRVKNKNPHNAIIVRHEDIASDPLSALNQVGDFFQLKKVNNFVGIKGNVFSSEYFKDMSDLTPVDVFWMNIIAGKSIRDLGYSRCPFSLSVGGMLKIIWSLFTFALWVPQVFFLMSKRIQGGSLGYLRRWVWVK
jgi:hypothetical protein